ncbi:kinesin-domain-containing protein [Rhizophagus irregularis]|uniref:Kinesin-like protein n=1 Tax=Rhizophagus irregularis TaxID=588596 RepID=A0A2N0NZ05_9GLOM|nr:kinesin-domain-containing protein [Rhizophagus irregularis]
MGDENIKVVVRCRPLNSREIARGANRLISMVGNQTFITRPDVNDPGNANKRDGIEDVKSFTFDKSYWSFDKNDPNYATQAMLYNDLGEEFLDYAFEGYNTCIFAYGQTSAGKSYSMMGYGEDKGIMPLTCCELFNRINNNKDLELTYQVQVSYIEIYNERVRDLLNPKNKGNLKVREHPALGPYVEDLSKLIVNSFIDIEKLMDESNKVRTVAATNMNETSGRSHAVFTLLVTQKRHDTQTNMDTEKVSRISFVDLAGSERANLTGATGTRLKEGANINKSLTTFGKVIASLAEFSVDKKKGKKEVFVPYRDSVLTWLLKDNLGGNSKTAMIAAISPADYVETLSTLRYADATRRIKNKAVVNEDPNTRLIRELKEELPMLRSKLGTYDSNELYDPSVPPSQQIVVLQDKSGNTIKKTKEELIDQTQASEKLMEEVNESWAEKARKTKEIQKEREKMLEELGIMVEKNVVGIHPPKKVPYLVNLNEDPLLSECLIYQIKPGKTRGDNILDEHCWFENIDGVVTLHPHENDATMVNGMYINKAKKLKSGFRIILGDFHENFHVFRFNNPQEVSERAKSKQLSINVPLTLNENGEDSAEVSPTSTDSLDTWIDWNFARREAALNSLNSRTDTTDTTDTRHITDTTDTRHTTDTTDTTDTTVGIDESLQREFARLFKGKI